MDNKSSTKLTNSQKFQIKEAAETHIKDLRKELQFQADKLLEKGLEYRSSLEEFADIDIDDAASDSAEKELAIAKVRILEGMGNDLLRIRHAPYFVRVDVVWKDTGESESLYFGKDLYKQENIYSWVSPISTLRYEEIGLSSYDRPDGTTRFATIQRKDNFLITKGDIVFMTHQDKIYDRQVVFQKHLNERKEFLLPEIVAELDKLQDQIIRSDPKGHFLISGPAGSGKTTLALHRVAYLVLTPEFKDYYAPDRIIVFVSSQRDIDYFSKLLPELGIEGVRITTFGEWATLVVNSRYTKVTKDRFKLMPIPKAVEYIAASNPFPSLSPRLVLDEFRKIKQELISPVEIKEGRPKLVYPTLHEWYLSGAMHLEPKVLAAFKGYLKFQIQNKYLDEVDLIILVDSVEHPPKQYTHVVVDEVQNWTPEQLNIISKLATRTHNSITFIGDIRQKTRVFTINSWTEINSEFAESGPRSVELLNVYRNSNPILKHLKDLKYDVNENTQKLDGVVVEKTFNSLEEMQKEAHRIIEEDLDSKKDQIAVISRYRESIERLEYIGHGDNQIHILTVEESQGLEFDSVIILDRQDFAEDFSNRVPEISNGSSIEYTEQGKFLYYVAATRAKQNLYVFSQ